MNRDLAADLQQPTASELSQGNFLGDFGAAMDNFASLSRWDKATEHILKLLRLASDWDGEGAPALDPDLVRSAMQLTEYLRRDGWDAPQDVYPCPNGSIILEWQYRDGIITRIEIEAVGRAEIMDTFPNAEPKFQDYSWLPPRPVGAVASTLPTEPNNAMSPKAASSEIDCPGDGSECENFQLAA